MRKVIKETFKKAWNWRLQKKWHVIPFVIVTLLVIYLLFSNFHITLTESLDKNIFYIGGRFPEVGPGDYVTLNVVYPYGEIPEEMTVTKVVRCMEGQHLKVNNLKFYCDGKYLGKAREETMSGKETTIFSYDGLIPEGKIFLMGPHEYSFDSRYFGLVEVSTLKLLLKPIF
jgi:signal peptidase I/conjugal transfer pilin signal peptidase TrbI